MLIRHELLKPDAERFALSGRTRYSAGIRNVVGTENGDYNESIYMETEYQIAEVKVD